ncbi:hypothetical protein EVAR_46651_1 [Eumeta japonica]|uniref:Uncharacterized protein n=1 Tax=Eumeta variegata TaxID=151549 RepID=A0A4C1WI41_EUMVA|nr:hypothetical protein EVAR_46651_1 [Eumeta japonica]
MQKWGQNFYDGGVECFHTPFHIKQHNAFDATYHTVKYSTPSQLSCSVRFRTAALRTRVEMDPESSERKRRLMLLPRRNSVNAM